MNKRYVIFILAVINFIILSRQKLFALHAVPDGNGGYTWVSDGEDDIPPGDNDDDNQSPDNDKDDSDNPGDNPPSDGGGDSPEDYNYDEDPEIKRREEEAKRLKEEYDRLYEKMGEISRKNGNTGNGIPDNLKKQKEAAKKAYDDALKELEEKKAEYRRRKDEERELENAMLGGDPVRVTVGSYEQNETDITFSGCLDFELKRSYISENKITGSFGYGWKTNLDQRIILGIEAGSHETREKLAATLNKQAQLIAEAEQSIISGFEVSSLENGEGEIIETIEKLRELGNQARAIAESESFDGSNGGSMEGIHEVSETNSSEENPNTEEDLEGSNDKESGSISYNNFEEENSEEKSDENGNDNGVNTGFTVEAVSNLNTEEIRQNLQELADEAAAKVIDMERKLEVFRNEIAQLRQMQSEYEAMRQESENFYANVILPGEERHTRNRLALFEGMGADYDKTGLDTVIVLDENGYPHLLYESEEESDIWKNDNDKKIFKCEFYGSGHRVFERNGSIKEFDENGFITKITDRNGNFVEIKRKTDEKIARIENSSGEKYDFEYSGSFISRIKNSRSPDENVVYGYSGNKLVNVKDTDGDTVTMSYDLDGRMTALNKCDGSSVRFEYGEQTADGLVLTTTTTNEEGFSEYFEYYRSQKRTDYIDHDGNRTSYWYDEKQRTVREVRPDGTDIRNEYDDFDNLVRTKENGNVTSFNYDRVGNKTMASYSDGSSENWTYDAYGKVTSFTDRDGVREEYIRDEKGNVTEYRKGGRTVYIQNIDSRGLVTRRTVYGENPLVTDYEYDSFGNLISESCGGVKTEYEYDSRNRIIKEKLAGKVISEYEYDEHKTVRKDFNGLETTLLTNGRKDLVEISQNDTVTGVTRKSRIEYDRRHLPLRVYEGDGENEVLTKGYSYTAEGKLKKEILYGEENWIREYEYKKGIICKVKQYKENGNAGDVFSQNYDYQLQNGNRKLLSVTDGLGSVSLFEYDSYGNLVKTSDANGEVRQKTYTRGGQLSKEQSYYGGWYEYGYTDGIISSAKEDGGTTVRAEYYPDGNLKSETDRYGKVTYYHYDSRGRVSSVQSEAKKIWYDYDDFDRVTKQIVGNSANVNNAVYYVNYEYSADGRSVTVTEGGKYKIVYELDAFGNIIKQTDGNNNERSFVYDEQNKLKESYDGYGNKTSYEYNSLGLISFVSLADGSQTKYEYNYMGLLSKVTDDCGTVYEAKYDKTGRLIKERERGDSEKSYEYDRGGRITKVLCGGEVIESYTYENNNRTITVKDGNGESYIYNYDGFGRLVNEKNRNGLEQNYFYDEEGELKSKNDFTGSTTTITYSSDRTVRTVTYSDGSQNRFVYDILGNIIEAQNAYGKTQYCYDQGGRMIYQKDVTTGEEIFFEYDSAGNRIKLLSTNRETLYSYGKNNEVKEIFDNKQRVRVQLNYNKVGREVLRKFGNGTEEHTLYDGAGRVTVKLQKTDRGDLLWGEGYTYGEDGKRTATVDNLGRVTLYEYNPKGQLSSVYYPYSQELADNLKEEAQLNGLSAVNDAGENKYLSSQTKASLLPLLNAMQYGLSSNLTSLHLFIKESYLYDRNGNRRVKTSPYGTIEYSYDKENCLLSSGTGGQSFVYYSYDPMGNLLTEESADKTVRYAYNAQNRLIYCEITDRVKKEYRQTSYAYDVFGRRIIVQDKGEAALRTLYDGLTFDVIKQSPTFADGMFTDSNETGIRWSRTGKPTGDRYRYISDEDSKDSNRYFYLDDGTYKTTNSRYRGERTSINVNGTLAAQTTGDDGPEYFSTDLLGSIRSVSDSYGKPKSSFNYDAFGSLVEGSLSGTSDFGYLGKQHDPTSRLYNYGYRDYKPSTSRFTTLDPIRDGTNWFTYCNGDPVNFVDRFGLAPRNMSESDRDAYKETVSKYKDYDYDSNKMGIPDDYDCADVATHINDKGMSQTSKGSQTSKLTHDNKPIDTNDIKNSVSSSDFFPGNTNNISFYPSKDFNNPYIEVGSVAVWKAKKGENWVGHIATIVEVERDKDGNVIRIVTIEGHLNSNTKVDFTNINQKIWDSYKGDFLGFGEIGADSTSEYNEDDNFNKNK